jgi:hypothetical protein
VRERLTGFIITLYGGDEDLFLVVRVGHAFAVDGVDRVQSRVPLPGPLEPVAKLQPAEVDRHSVLLQLVGVRVVGRSRQLLAGFLHRPIPPIPASTTYLLN